MNITFYRLSSRLHSLIWMCLIKTVEDLNRTKSLTILLLKTNSSCLAAGSWDTGSSLPSDLN